MPQRTGGLNLKKGSRMVPRSEGADHNDARQSLLAAPPGLRRVTHHDRQIIIQRQVRKIITEPRLERGQFREVGRGQVQQNKRKLVWKS
jgi:hypothetical protein